MKILAIEMATEACSAALLIDGSLVQRYQVAPREHGNLILQMVDELLKEAGVSLQQLDALAFGQGPGSFTGVRMATGVIQGLAFAADVPVVGVSTLMALAQQVENTGDVQTIYAAMDARMGEVYWCEYQSKDGVVKPTGDECVILPHQVSAIGRVNTVAIGHGWRTYSHELEKSLGAVPKLLIPDALPRAKEVALLAVNKVEKGETVSAENALPVYLRDNVAKKKEQQK